MKNNPKSRTALSVETEGKVRQKYADNEQAAQLQKLFEKELRDIYWAEQALLRAIPKMLKEAVSEDLISVLEGHLSETEGQIIRIEQIFSSLGKEAEAKKCLAMEGLIKEAEEMMQNCKKGMMCDVGIIASIQKVEHYEIASYHVLRTLAQSLDLNEAVLWLGESLNEERDADEKLGEVIEFCINAEVAYLEEETAEE